MAMKVHYPDAGLTTREKQLLAMMSSDLPIKDVARRLAIPDDIVTAYLATIYCKIAIANRSALAIRGVRSPAQAVRSRPTTMPGRSVSRLLN
jgi:DNA-binding NarL/FixJ family response regulator